MSRDGLKEEHRRALVEILSACDRVEGVVLFGSRAMGTGSVTSDVDLALFGDELTLGDQASLAARIEALSMPQRADLVRHATIQSPALLAHIQEHGVTWWARSNARDSEAAANETPPHSTS